MKRTFLLIILTTIAATFAHAQVSNIKSVNFKNYKFKLDDRTVQMTDGIEKGACEKKDPEGIPTGDIWSVANVVYGDLNADAKAEAIVSLVANVCGGNMITNEQIVVFTAKNGKAVQLPTFEYFDEGCVAGEPGCNFARNPGASVRYDSATKALVVETTFSTDEDAICCPSLQRDTWYKWNGTAFVEIKRGKIFKREEAK